MIGRVRSIVVDTRDPRGLAEFWVKVLGGTITQDGPDWVVLVDDRGRRMAFQLAPLHEPPQFPDPHGSQQFHLDLDVEDVDEAERQVLALGATRLPYEGADFRVFRDPAGHTFCLVFGVEPAD
jgi:hypothetical protein